MARHVRTISNLFARQARRADHVLRATGGRRGMWRWVIPLGGFALCAAVLLVAGIVSGVSALEYIPIAFFEALVIGGLFVVCISPVIDPPESDEGGKGPGDDPTSAPPPFDPSIWVSMLPGSDAVKERDAPRRPTRQKERIGARR